MSKNKTNTKDLVEKIEKITRERLKEQQVVSLDQYRELTKKSKHKTVLVIDDDETMRTAFQRIFEGEGYKVLLAADGTQLSEVVGDDIIDIIILDVGLPWLNGFELAKLIRESEDLKTTPIVFVSGKTSELDIRRGFEVGANDYIKKPFDVENIKKTVSTLLKLQK